MKDHTSSEPESKTPNHETYTGDFVSHSADETFEFARSFGKQLTGGEVFLLTGDLGAGKTIFAKGIAAGLGIQPVDVTSPTFTLINIHDGRLRFYHIDLYRLDNVSQSELGLEEILDDRDAVVAIEWAERLNFVPDRATRVEMEYASNDERKIRIE